MKKLMVEIGDDTSRSFEELLDGNLGWTKAMVVRALLSYFLTLSEEQQRAFLKKYGTKVKKT